LLLAEGAPGLFVRQDVLQAYDLVGELGQILVRFVDGTEPDVQVVDHRLRRKGGFLEIAVYLRKPVLDDFRQRRLLIAEALFYFALGRTGLGCHLRQTARELILVLNKLGELRIDTPAAQEQRQYRQNDQRCASENRQRTHAPSIP